MLREDLKYITTEYLRDTNQIQFAPNCCISEDWIIFKILLFEENGSFFRKKLKMLVESLVKN